MSDYEYAPGSHYEKIVRERDEARRDRETLQMAVVEANRKLRNLEAERDRLREALATLYEMTAGCWDEGPPGEGWPSDELIAARVAARKALAGTEGE